ncbi:MULTISPECIES: hypothetical protein [Hymenobacter]|uniref:SpoIIAA-like n=1 Tax=Hymenobacter mucosus TaxID=1411120 RepID=A0A238V2E5_9BACT|nr:MULTISPECIES: hypothetical protein [Hymenobacter]SNR28712.1 hypothetical protein SAMN06269173_10138 [Hymenobacter mucosus]
MRSALSFPYLNVYIHEVPSPTLETHWLGFANSTDFRASLTQALQLGRQLQVKGWIADDRLLGAVRPRDLQWTHEKILLPLDTIGLQRFALLESSDTLNRLTIASMYHQASPDVRFEIQRFDQISRARAWASGLV